MQSYHNSAVLQFDSATTGNAAVTVPVTVRVNSTQALAVIYDLAEVSKANPTATDSKGNYNFKAGNGVYDIIISEGTANEVKLEKIQLSTLTGVSNEYLINDLSQAYTFATVAAMTASAIAFPVNKKLVTSGYYVEGDSGGAEYLYKGIVEFNAVPNGYVDHYIGVGNNFVAVLIHLGELNVKQCGAAGDWFDYDTGTVNPSPTDDTLAIQAVYDYMTRVDGITGFGWSLYFPTSYYGISSEISTPSVTQTTGDGRFQSHIKALAGFSGVMFGDKGSGAKVYVNHLEIDSQDESGVTDIVKMGYGIPFGTEGIMNDLFLRGGQTNGVNNTQAINVIGNVGSFHDIAMYFTKSGVFEGGNSVANIYSDIVILGCKTYGMLLRTNAKVINTHIEAPVAGCQPFRVNGDLTLINSEVSLSDDDITNIISMSSGSSSIAVAGLQVLTANAGSITNILDDQRISVAEPNWANNCQFAGIYNFNANFETSFGSNGYAYSNPNQNLELNNREPTGSTSLGSNRAGTLEYFVTNATLGFDGPGIDNARNLARATHRYTDAYFVNAPTVTSDVRTKKDIESIPQELLDFVVTVEVKQYKLIINNSERFHFGIIITPEFIVALNEVYSIDKCGALCHELFTNEEGETIYIEIGGVVLGDIWQVRHGEWQNLLLEAMRRKLS